ncbi:MAG: hypothetical protein P1U86_19465 [Verrucomicrobiales bacterium]|nr:hypothetical protein [Verrucomicrobiales bacterium]
MNRTKLFKLQGILSILLIIIATVQTALQSAGADILKVAIAPFGAVSLLLFAFFVYNRERDELNDDEVFRIPQVLANLVIVGIAGAVVILLTSLIGDLTSTLDRVLFCFSMLIAVILFLYEKIRNFRSMAILTGIGEGAAILLLFFR